MRRGGQLVRFLREEGKKISPLLILTHDHPDPDAVASAWGLKRLAESRFGIRCQMAYGGIVGRIENQTMVRLLNVPIRPLKPKVDFKRFQHIALVDTQPDFGNNPFPDGRQADLIIDHHPVNDRRCARCAVIVPDAAATSVIIAQAFLQLREPIPTRLATALVYGILSETQDLGRDVRDVDIRVYKKLLGSCDLRSLARIENPQRPLSFFRGLNKSLDNAFVIRDLIVAHLGKIDTPDLVSQMADFLLTCEGMRWSLCTGRYQNHFHASVRALKPKLHAGKLLQKVLGEKSRAGGHHSIAGGSVSLKHPIREATWRKMEREIVSTLVSRLHKKGLTQTKFPFRSR